MKHPLAQQIAGWLIESAATSGDVQGFVDEFIDALCDLEKNPHLAAMFLAASQHKRFVN